MVVEPLCEFRASARARVSDRSASGYARVAVRDGTPARGCAHGHATAGGMSSTWPLQLSSTMLHASTTPGFTDACSSSQS